MARPELDRIRQQGELDPTSDRLGEVVFGRDRHAPSGGQGPIGLHDPERDEQAGNRWSSVDLAERIGDPNEGLGAVDGLVGDRRTVDEPGHEVALRPDERRDLWSHADPGRGDRRRMLDLATDPEQVGVVAGEPDDPAFIRAGRLDQEVPVRDPAGQGPKRQVAAGKIRHALHHADELVAQLAAEHLAD